MNYLEPLHIAITAWVFVMFLTNENEPLYFWRRLIEKIPTEYIRNPLVECEYCVAGQLSLWYYIIKYWENYSVVENIFFVTTTIFIVELINRVCKMTKVLSD